MKKNFLLTVVLMMVLIIGCGEKDGPVDTEGELPPPPTAEEIASDIRTAFEGQLTEMATGKRLTRKIGDDACSALRSKVNANRAEENGPEAISKVSFEVEQIARIAHSAEKWDIAMLGCLLYETIEPSSTTLARIKKRSDLEIKRPRISDLGFVTMGGETTVFLKAALYDGRIFDRQVTVGEEFFGLRLESIIGRQRGISLEYIETGQLFDVMKGAPSVVPKPVIPKVEEEEKGGKKGRKRGGKRGRR